MKRTKGRSGAVSRNASTRSGAAAKGRHDLARTRDLLEAVAATAAGDLTREVTVAGSDAIGQIGDGLQKFIVDLRQRIGIVTQMTASLTSASVELSATSQQITVNGRSHHPSPIGCRSRNPD